MEPTENKGHFLGGPGFTPAAAGAAFGPGFLEEAVCRWWVLRQLHGDRAFCPGCGSALDGRQAERFWGGDRARCADCGKKFGATTGSILAGSHFTFAKVFLLAVLLSKGTGHQDAAAVVGCDPETVRLWEKRFAIHG